jgi:hypothetical protein
MPEEFTEYFRNSFKYARHIIESETNAREKEDRAESYKDILEICRKRDWPAANEDRGAASRFVEYAGIQ